MNGLTAFVIIVLGCIIYSIVETICDYLKTKAHAENNIKKNKNCEIEIKSNNK